MRFLTKFFSPLIHHQANADALLLSELLNRQDQHALIFADYFENITLDYSLISLKKIDRYLAKVRNYYQHQQALSAQQKQEYIDEITQVVLRVGAYLGETLRQQNKDWIWIKSKEQRFIDAEMIKVNVLILTDHTTQISPIKEVATLISAEEQTSSLYQYAQKILSD
jgi:hypothetical protein